jgi:hypothetical protein
MKYLDALVQQQIIPAAMTSASLAALEEDVNLVWQDWRQRFLHPSFGLSTFLITQISTVKGGIRWGPTVTDLIAIKAVPTTAAMALAYATLLRWLTPIPQQQNTKNSNSNNDIFRGWLDGFHPHTIVGQNFQHSAKGEERQRISGIC